MYAITLTIIYRKKPFHFGFRYLYQTLLTFVFFLSSNFVLAHDHHGHDHDCHTCEVHGPHIEEAELEPALALFEPALALFEKAYQLSPDLLPHLPHLPHSLIPYYKMRGNKIPLNQSFVVLMREWVNLFADEIEKNCDDCDIDREKLLEEAVKQELTESPTNYSPENRFLKTASSKLHSNVQGISQFSVQVTTKYGKVTAALLGISEAFETVASVFMGMKGIHFICTPLQILIIPLGRKIQRYGRALFHYGPKLSHSSLLLTSKMAWTTRTLHKKRRDVFFIIDQALQFNQEQLEQVNSEGPTSLFRQGGHRLLWLERLQQKTDPLFTKKEELKIQLEQEGLTEVEKTKLTKKIHKLEKRIEELTKINQKEFFGNRFKRYLFLKSRKGRRAYMDGSDLKPFDFIHRTLGSRALSWPLAPQFMVEQTLEKKDYTNTSLGEVESKPHKASDDVISGLVDEFLTEISYVNSTESGHSDRDKELFHETDQDSQSLEKKQAVEFFLSDFHNIFDVNQTLASRLMSAQAIEVLLTQFFAHYLRLAEDKILSSIPMSFREKLKFYGKIGSTQALAMEFGDFLIAVSMAKQSDKINFYKYETIEKFFTFLHYFGQLGQAIKKNPSAQELLEQLGKAHQRIQSFSLTREKNQQINYIPLRKRAGKCYDMTRKYQ